ncbi:MULTISPECIES: ABC transporter permease [unclassified Nocardioides]|jgi:simple sugar transport system permease protein|uniref:ABC transporter permease n=1 Tax=unclassified Nocardioides TaxID=2615069 RepID=UPI001150FAD9|nr:MULTISPECIES: ABC transporter permease [unclassified Nocardioides]TQK68872.1 monosaccharide ABC transporter membrane protein (CUT2 family) [Nocardioides sp. SLBN-35]WGY01871.1 ABC transporter permease [Nocardioides sp. QY071]
MSATTTSVPDRDARRDSRRDFVAKNFGVISISVVFVVLFAYFSLASDAFLTTTNLVNVLRQVAPTVIVAVGMTFVITTGQIDLSVGSIVGLSAAALGLFAESGNPVVALVGTLAIALAIGLASGMITAFGKVQSFIVTLAALTAVRGVALLITDGYSTPITSDFLLPLGQGSLAGIYTPTWIAVIAVIAGWYVFNHTRFGRYVTAVGSNDESLRRAGVDIRRIQVTVLGLTGVLAGLAGVITAARLGSGSSNSGTAFELEVITAVVLGGTSLMGGRGSIIGSAVGALTLGIINNGLVLSKVDVYWVPITQGLILIVAIFLNSKLFGRIVGTRG